MFSSHDSQHFMAVPAGKGPFPAVIMLHASSGVANVNYEWATLLKNKGYIVYLIDSFGPRGWKDRLSVGWEKATMAQLEDVAPAYDYIRHLPNVDPNRIGILGFSMGGFTVLQVRTAGKTSMPRFTAAASVYGVCHRLLTNTKIKGPTTIFIGSDDDRATTRDCEKLVEYSNNPAVSIITYPHAQHGFDNSELPASKEATDEKGEHYHLGYNKQAKELLMHDLPAFFDQYLKHAR